MHMYDYGIETLLRILHSGTSKIWKTKHTQGKKKSQSCKFMLNQKFLISKVYWTKSFKVLNFSFSHLRIPLLPKYHFFL